MKKNRFTTIVTAMITGLLILSSLAGQIVRESDPSLEGIDVVPHMGEQIPLNLMFTNENGDPVALESFFHQGKPVIFTLSYTDCKMLCTLVLDGLANGLNELGWKPGDSFQMVNVSIDTTETSLKSAARREQYVSKLKMGAEPGGWQFLVGQRKSIDGLAQSLGFQYYYDEKQDQYAHPAVVFILTSEGIISRYLFGIEFRGRDLKLALLEAADEKVSSTFEKLILYCFHYDTDAQGYVLMAANVMKLGGAVTLFFVVITLGLFWIRERTRPNPATQKAKN